MKTNYAIIFVVLVGITSSTKIGLRDPEHWDSWNNLDLLNQYMGGFNFGKNQLQSDSFLNQLAQAAAEQDDNQQQFIREYSKKISDNLIVFGIKLRGNTTYKQILTEDYNSVMDGMPGFLFFRYKNNTMNVDVVELKELMDLTNCDTLAVPLKCNNKACENLWNGGSGEFRFSNDNYNYRVRFNNMLKVFKSMADSRQDRYSLDIFRDTYHTETYRNDNYEMEFEVPNFFGKGFWSNDQTGVWGIGDQITTILTHGGNIRATSDVQHQYLKVHLEINEPYVQAVKPTSRLSDAELRDVIESHFKTMYEMYDREQVFNSLNKYGEGYALDSNNNINIVFAMSGPVNNNVRTLDRERRLSLFNRLKQWPWFASPPSVINNNPFSRNDMISVWRKALGLSMGPINKDRRNDNLPELKETDPVLTQFAQKAANLMASSGKFVAPSFSSRQSNTLVVAMKLSGQTRINEYAFLLNDHNFGQVTCFDNFSNTVHKVHDLVDNFRYACSKNNNKRIMLEMWRKYTTYGTGHATNANGDAFMAIALTY